MPEHFADRLCAAIAAKGTPACVGIDPVYDQLPEEFRAHITPGHPIENAMADEDFRDFGMGVIEAVARWVPAVKINSAFFEAITPSSLLTYFEVVDAALQAGLIVIGDVKRGDIGHSAAAYACGHLSKPSVYSTMPTPDAITVNSYFGLDGLRPFIAECCHGKGVFALVQTSNESAAEIQNARLTSGDTLAMHVARLVNRWAGEPGLLGRSGYSALGAVVSPRDRESTRALRTIMERCIFLVPGYGAQGKSVDEIAECFKPDGTGAIVNASRSVIYAFNQPRYREEKRGSSWQSCVEAACKDFVREVNAIVQARSGG